MKMTLVRLFLNRTAGKQGGNVLFMCLCLLTSSGFSQLSTFSTPDVYTCISKGIAISTSPSGGVPPYTYSWSPAGSLSNSSIANPIATPVTTTQYIVTISDNGMVNTITDTVTIHIGNFPPDIEVIPAVDTICDGDTIQLKALNKSSCDVAGNTCSGTLNTTEIGTGALQSSAFTISPYHVFGSAVPLFNRKSNIRQIIYRKSELVAQGLTDKSAISSIAFFTNSFLSSWTYESFSIKMGCTVDSVFLTNTFKTGLKTVFEPKTITVPVGAGWNEHVFDEAFNWDGNSNIVIEICFSNTVDIGFGGPLVRFENIGETVTSYRTGSTSVCGFTSGSATALSRPHIQFKHCEVTHSTPLVFSWSPATGLSASNIYNPEAAPLVNTDYILTATDTNGCIVTDTAKIEVASNFSITPSPDSGICSVDSFDLIAIDNAGIGTRYEWAPSGIIGNPTAAITKGYVDGPVEFQLTVTSAGGCAKFDTFLVDVLPPINLDIVNNDTSICAGDSIDLNVTTNLTGCSAGPPGCSSPNSATLGTHQFSLQSAAVSPFGVFGINNSSQKKQVLILQSELQSMGINDPSSFADLAIDISALNGNTTFDNFTIKMGCTNTSSFPFNSPFETGVQTVFTPKTININAGWNTFTFDNSFHWDGDANVVIEFCFSNATPINVIVDNQSVFATNAGFAATLSKMGTATCNDANGAFISFMRPDIRFNYCEAPPRDDLVYAWSPVAGLSDPNIAQPKASPSITTTYILTANEPNALCTESDTVTITVAPDFAITTSNDTFLCQPGAIIPVAVNHTSPAPTSISWEPSSIFANPTALSTTATIGQSESLIVQASSIGCIKTDTIDVNVLDQLTTTVDASKLKLCLGENTQLTAEINLGCGTAVNGPCASPNSSEPINGAVFTSNFSNTSPFLSQLNSTKRQYLFRQSELVTAGMGQSTAIQSISMNITNPGTETEFENFTVKMLCTSVNQLTSSFIAGAQTVVSSQTYTTTPGVNLITFDQPYNWDGISNLLIEICYSNSGFSFPFSQNATVEYNFPVFNSSFFVNGSTSVCNSTSGVALNIRPVIEFNHCDKGITASYDWSPPLSLDNPAIATPVATPTATTNYIVTITEDSSKCEFIDSVEISISDYNIDATPDTTLCTSKDFQLNVNTNATPPVTYEWFPASEVTDSSLTNPIITIDNGTQYIVEVTDSTGCVKEDTVNIDFFPEPLITITADTSICRTDNLNLFATGGVFYSWAPETGLNNALISNPIVSGLDATTKYILTLEDINSCLRYDSITVTVFPSPIIDLGVDSFYCQGYETILDASNNFNSYTWHDGSTESTYQATPPGIYSVTAIDNFDCSISDTISIGTLPTPQSGLKSNYNLCANDSLVLDAGNVGSTYLWSTGATSKTIEVFSGGPYWVEIFDGSCLGKDSLLIKDLEYPISTLPPFVRYCEKELPFGAPVSAGGPEYAYHWSNGKRSGQIEIADPGTYTVRISNSNCSVMDTVDISLYCETKLFVPNSFTPNNDLHNDVFSIASNNIFNFRIQVFNRWGELIYESDNPRFEWDGTYNGKLLGQDVYLWNITYDERNSEGGFVTKKKRGDLLLLR